MHLEIMSYFASLHNHLKQVECSDRAGAPLGAEVAFDQAARFLCNATMGDNKIIFIGNGGSAGIASHMAIDYSKNGGLRALAFNDAAALTCLGNDLGYDRVFEHQIQMHARAGDIVAAISSSGRSDNILRAVDAASRMGCRVITFSGFTPDNPLRGKGDVNFYLASDKYGFIEVGHLALIHALLDLIMNGVLARGESPFSSETPEPHAGQNGTSAPSRAES
jgi:D-sedoheptulose 7-phosphate isomerase